MQLGQPKLIIQCDIIEHKYTLLGRKKGESKTKYPCGHKNAEIMDGPLPINIFANSLMYNETC